MQMKSQKSEFIQISVDPIETEYHNQNNSYKLQLEIISIFGELIMF